MAKLCLCDGDPEHEICWDGIVSVFDPECACCQDTAAQLADSGNDWVFGIPSDE